MHRHLIAVEVSVEGGADQGMDPDSATVDEDGLEGLDAKAMEGRRPVQEDRPLLDDLIEDVPNLGLSPLHDPLG